MLAVLPDAALIYDHPLGVPCAQQHRPTLLRAIYCRWVHLQFSGRGNVRHTGHQHKQRLRNWSIDGSRDSPLGRHQSSAVIFTPSGSGAAGGLRAWSRLGQSRAKCPAWPQLKQAPIGGRTAGCAAG